MPVLASDLRKTLEATVVKARDKAEGGARDALTALAVDASDPFASMSDEERKLRNRLRARGRQLGDQRDAQKGTQRIERLVREMAYEHWHRMLFARFLAENQLLIEPSSGVSVSLDECEELAAEEGIDLWGLAAQFAQAMLPQIFRTDDPVLAAKLPLEIRQQLQGLVAGLETETFTANDSLGWTYQFWQTKRKKEVNASEVDIGADELPAVTQLFTEEYMVDFLVDNTLGAWHAGKVLTANPQLASTAQTEDDLRQAVALPGCPWNYLRFIQAEDGMWAPASGSFEGWPNTAAALKCLDPCMGSGHFVVAMFDRLVALRIKDDGLTEMAAVQAVIEDNLFGLEIDPRCTQIGAFNLALAAWRRVGYCSLPAMNLACSGLAPNSPKADWLAIAGDNERLRNGMERLYELFEKASVLGSLINPRAAEGGLLVAGFHELQPLLEKALAQETKDDTAHEMAVTARGLAKAAEILSCQFTLVSTNVPFLGGSRQDALLAKHLDSFYGEAKADLATAMIYRMRDMASNACSIAFVSPQTWMFLRNYKGFRLNMLRESVFNCVAALGSRAFETITGEVVNVVLSVLTKTRSSNTTNFLAIDANSAENIQRKRSTLASGDVLQISQVEQVANPDHTIVLSRGQGLPRLSEYASSWQGLVTGDTARFVIRFWEVPSAGHAWENFISSPSITADYCGRDSLVRWEKARGALHNDSGAHNFPPASVIGKEGVLLSQGKTARATLFTGEIFNDGSVPIIPKRKVDLLALYAFLRHENYTAEVRKINQKLIMGCGYFIKVPFDLAHWQKVAAEKYPDGLPKPFSSDSTQWLFNGYPAGADQPLHVAVARLVGYQWPRQTGSSFPDCPALDPDGLETLADDDGIVCLAPVHGEASAVERFRKLLAAALGEEWSTAKERELLLATAVDNNAKKPEPDLDSWLRSCFFSEHCKLFHSRPFIWQIWDGNPHGFSALVNYHKLAAPNGQGRKTLEQLTYTYLGDWIDRQKLDQAEGVNGADDRLSAALDLQGQLKKILEGEPPYDIFVRWNSLHQQAIGWDPDINDGVRLNIRPFLNAQLHKGGKTGAGILRAKPGTIKWAKDRGKEPMRSKDDFPWFWSWDENSPAMATDFGAPVPGAPPAGDSFDGNRWNDLHYTRAAKEAARARHTGGES